MLQFIFGKPLSGKSHLIRQMIKELSMNGENSVLLVPEQSSFQSEKVLLSELGEKIALNTAVLSFERLYDDVLRASGGICSTLLNDADKIILMNRALNNSFENLAIWKKYVHSLSFSKTILDTIGEFKINSVKPEEIKKAAENVTNIRLKEKLNEIATVYSEYDILLGERFLDSADKISKLYDKLETCRYFAGKQVFIDGFKGFTGGQLKVISRIIEQAENVYIAFTDNCVKDCENGIFSNIRKTVKKIEKYADNYGIKISTPIILNESHYEKDELDDLEKLISGVKTEFSVNDTAITVCKAEDMYDEAEFVARTIKKLVRTQNLRFKDFVIVARNGDDYSTAVKIACKKNGINLFFDSRIPLSSFPICVAAKAAIEAVKLSTEEILKFHKTRLGTLSFNEISDLENYCYLWNINGENWLKEWDMNPEGFDSFTDDSEDKLKYLNELRVRALNPILKFKESFKGNAKQMATAIIELFSECNSAESMEKIYDRTTEIFDGFSAETIKLSYDEFLNTLDSLVRSFPDSSISKKQFYEALDLAMNTVSVGVIPQTLDQVTFGSADKIRAFEPKIVFIIGANQGVFPQSTKSSGILNISERRDIIKNGIEISDNSIDTAIDEEYLVYKNLCSAKTGLYISYSTVSLNGDVKEPSAFISKITDSLKVIETAEPVYTSSFEDLPESYEAAFSRLCRNNNLHSEENTSLIKALSDTEFSNAVDLIDDLKNQSAKKLSCDSARNLYGDELYISATKLDRFNHCKFSYFCEFGLKAKKIQPVDFDVMQRGTVVHYVLEKIVEEHKDEFKDVQNNTIYAWVDGYIEKYLSGIKGFNSVRNNHTNFIISRISRSLKEVAVHIVSELAQSDFKPVKCELKIGKGESTCLNFPLENGNISIKGSIDRVDEYNGYIRIIDYKTGSKEFKLPDILFGLNMQMLLYLYAVIRGNNKPDSDAAAILYQPAKRKTDGKGLTMNGLMVSNSELHDAMEKENEGKYVPKISINKDGTVSKVLTSYIENENFTQIFNHIELIVKKCGNEILSGDISVLPLDGRESEACKYCNFKSVCGIENKPVSKVASMSNAKVFETLKESEENEIQTD